MPTLAQANRFAGITTPLGEDEVVLSRASISESLSEPYLIDIDLLSENPDVSFDSIIGRSVTVRLDLPGGDKRYFNGIVNSFSQVQSDTGFSAYHATAVPSVWLLSRTSHCRIYQNKKVPDILHDIFSKANIEIDDRLHGTYQEWIYCVQYRETDLNFISRLMEHEGIYYFFTHDDGAHKLVLADSPSAHETFPGFESIVFRPHGDDSAAGNFVRRWASQKVLLTTQYAHTDYDFEKPRTNLLRTEPTGRYSADEDREIYDYPGSYTESSHGEDLGKIRMDEIAARYESYKGDAESPGIAVGCKFTLTQSPNVSFPRDDEYRDYVVKSTVSSIFVDDYRATGASGESQFQSSFEVFPADAQYRPPRITPKPVVHGPQTAIITGPKGEEIYTDKYGRVKVQFHWDRDGKNDENSSCWMRVAQMSAGKRWGVSFWPRLGQEVVVAFLEGDPDQPIIVGSVYNAEQMPPYQGEGLDGKHKSDNKVSGIKTNSTLGGTGYNELRFDDTKGKEQVFIHAERNMDVRIKNDSLDRTYGNRHQIIGWEKDGGKGGSQNEMVYQDKNIKIHRHHIEHIGGNMQLLVGGIDGPGTQDIVIQSDKKELIQGSDNLRVNGDRKQKIDGNQSLIVGGNQQEKVGQKHAVDAGQEIHLKAGMKVTIEAGVELCIKGAGGFIDIGPSGVTIQGTMVLINSGGSAGSGSGSSPDTPDDAQQADPTEPSMADESKSGQKSARS